MGDGYIKKEDAIKAVASAYWQGTDCECYAFARKALENVQTVDAVPVVRCKDCRFSEVFQNDSSGVMARYCKAFRLVRMVADDDFCSCGERRDDEIDRR